MTNAKKVVTKEETRPCGCHVTEFSDKTATISPCPPCGLMDVARNLGSAANALAAVATRLRAEASNVAVNDAIRAMHKEGKG